jgi:alpha-beta hydrolase superfamily lysophospholipase
VRLFWQAWLPDAEPRAVVVISHGVSEHGGRYAWVAERLTRRGFAVYAGDHRGHGRSTGPRVLVNSMDDFVRDLDAVVEMAQGAHPAAKTVLLGHSMGGAVAIAYAIEHQDRLDMLVLSAPLAVLGAASPVERTVARILSAVAPRVGVYAVESEGVSRDPAVVRDYDADPLNYHGKLPARTIKTLTDALNAFPEGIATLSLPILTMHSAADRLTPPAGSELVIERAGSEDKSIIRYEDLYHELLNEPERQKVLDDIVEWVEARL